MLILWLGVQSAGIAVMTWVAKRESRRTHDRALLAGQYKSVPTPFLDRWIHRHISPRMVSKAERWQAQRMMEVARWCSHRKFFEDLVLATIASKKRARPGRAAGMWQRFVR